MLKLLTQKKNRNFLKLWTAQLISQFGDRIHQLALVGLIAERAPGSAMGLAKLLAFTIIPVFIVQPFAGVFVDRWDRKTTLFVCDVARGFLVLAIPLVFIFWTSMIEIYIVVFFAFCFSRFYVPAKMSIIPDLVDAEDLPMANSLVSTTGMMAFVAGCALGGFLIDKFGARAGFFIDSFTFFLSGLVMMTIARPLKLHLLKKEEMIKASKEIVGPISQSVFTEIKEGFQYLIQHKEIRFIIEMIFILLAAAGSIYVVIIVFIQSAFNSATKDLGVLAVFLGIGLFVGALLYGKFGKKVVWYKAIFICLILGGVMLALFAWLIQYYPNIYCAMGLAFWLGLVIGPIFIASNSMIHIVCHDNMRGKVFSALEIVIHFAFLVAMLISSWISEYVDGFWILITVAGIFAVVGIVGLLRKKIEIS